MGDKHSSNKILATIVGLVVAIIGSTGLVVATHAPGAKVSVTRPGAVQPAKSPFTHISYKGEDGKTALDILRAHAQVTTRQSSFGEYVESVDEVQDGTNNKHWTFYVNGSPSPMWAGSYVSKAGDTIEWKFE